MTFGENLNFKKAKRLFTRKVITTINCITTGNI